MTCGRNTFSGISPGQQGTGGHAPISRPICNITPAHQAEGTIAEVESKEESEAGSAIIGNSDDPDDPDNLPEE